MRKRFCLFQSQSFKARYCPTRDWFKSFIIWTCKREFQSERIYIPSYEDLKIRETERLECVLDKSARASLRWPL
jgi:hypothetical protein